MAIFAFDNPTLLANGNAVDYMPNSVRYDDGDGETTVRNTSSGGGKTKLLISESVEDKVAKLMFDVPNDIASINAVRGWKKNPGKNVFELNGNVNGTNFSKVFTSAVVKNPVENELSADGKVSVEVSSEPT